MLGKALTRDYDPGRLRRLLAVFFLALAIPTGGVIWQAYGQLKFEAFYQYRNQAEALSRRIDSGLIADINQAEARRFADFAFLNVAADAPGRVAQRSPLADYPVTADVSGVIGYFQVGANGEFTTPLLPVDGNPADLGLTDAELAQRTYLANEIQRVLADNRLVRNRPTAAAADAFPTDPDDAEEIVTDGVSSTALESLVSAIERDETAGGLGLQESLRSATSDAPQPAPAAPAEIYSQQVFDTLNLPTPEVAEAENLDLEETGGDAAATDPRRQNSLAKLRDLNLDDALERKSEDLSRRLGAAEAESAATESRRDANERARRVEQVLLPAAEAIAEPQLGSEFRELNDGRISTFESEVDPYEFSLLDSGHMVLFRKVWRDGERYIQGLLIDRAAFLATTIDESFQTTPLADMSSLIVAYQDDILSVIDGTRPVYPVATGDLEGTLLYRTRLSAPFERLELVYSITRLPPGPAATVLAWSTVVIALVFVAGFYALYRLGLGQIRLARQQQDFVSAVSHELKTPLTSIRMYGEMLKEGWADESKREQYYDYIHDESERLSRLISNVLQLARITRNEPQFDARKITIGALLDQVQSKIAHQVERAGFELRIDRDSVTDAHTVTVDEDCFAQIVINLVDNGIKFSKDADEKRIEIGAAASGDDAVTLSIRDYGPGIPKDQLKKIFTLFYRSESELTRETVGTGIGLAIVHQLTLAMDGKVDVLNRDPGVEFRLSFPTVD